MARKSRRVSATGKQKISRALLCGWRPWLAVGPGVFLKLRRVRRARGCGA